VFGFDGGFGRIWLGGAHYLLLLGYKWAVTNVPCTGDSVVFTRTSALERRIFAV
jgi:hypothetical protein